MFGDRWNFLQVCGYLWVIAGMVAHALKVEGEEAEESAPAEDAETPLADDAVLA
jgi:hypothetical protein